MQNWFDLLKGSAFLFRMKFISHIIPLMPPLCNFFHLMFHIVCFWNIMYSHILGFFVVIPCCAGVFYLKEEKETWTTIGWKLEKALVRVEMGWDEKFCRRNDTMAKEKLKIGMIIVQGRKAAYVSQQPLCTFSPLHCYCTETHRSPETSSFYLSPCPQDESPYSDCHCSSLYVCSHH